MIYKLEKENYGKVKHLVENFTHQLCTISQIAGNTYAGDVFVDELNNPKSVLLFSSEGVMLAGDPTNKDFNNSLKDHIKQWASLVCDSDKWDVNIKEVLENAALRKYNRLHYTLTELKYKNWRDNVPEGYQVVKIDKEFFKMKDLENFQSTANYADIDDWNPELKMQEFGFGYCIVDTENKVIASSSTIDCMYQDKIEMGIRTDYRYRRKGLAAIVVASTVEDYISKGIKEFGWQCVANNIGSYKTAEKIGFKRTLEYHCFYFNEFAAENICDFTKAEWLHNAKILESRGDLPSLDWCAYCYAATGNLEKKIKYLNFLLDHSWRYEENQFKNDEFFAPFYGSNEWKEFENRFAKICKIRKKITKDNWNESLKKEDFEKWLDIFNSDKYFSLHSAICYSVLNQKQRSLEIMKSLVKNKYFYFKKDFLRSWRFKNLENELEWNEMLKKLDL
jgi:RimJ/RimL family protein N-acetyltransferase